MRIHDLPFKLSNIMLLSCELASILFYVFLVWLFCFIAQYLFICGDASGVGKSSISMGLLHGLLSHGYKAEELAYIKPCTQCEDIQLVTKFCEQHGIAHEGVGPVIFVRRTSQTHSIQHHISCCSTFEMELQCY